MSAKLLTVILQLPTLEFVQLFSGSICVQSLMVKGLPSILQTVWFPITLGRMMCEYHHGTSAEDAFLFPSSLGSTSDGTTFWCSWFPSQAGSFKT